MVNTMKHLITALVISAGLATSTLVIAHDKGGTAKYERLAEKLNLSDARSEELKSAMKDFHDKKRVIRETAREQMKQLREERKTVLESLLSEEEMAVLTEQFEKRNKSKKRHYKRHAKHGIEE